MTGLLLSQGHSRIAVVYEHPERTSIKLRMEGVRDRTHAAGLELPPIRQLNIPPDRIRAERNTIHRPIQELEVTALFAFECQIAHALAQLLETDAIRIRQDVSLCTFDDVSLFTGVRDDFFAAVVQPVERIDRIADEIVLGDLAPTTGSPTQMLIMPQIVKKRSVSRPPL